MIETLVKSKKKAGFMGVLILLLFSIMGGVVLHALAVKHGFTFAVVTEFFERFSSPYNALVTFGLSFLLLLGGHNSVWSSAGGALVLVGLSTVIGLLFRAGQGVAALVRQTRDVHYSDGNTTEYAEVRPEVVD